MDRRLSRPQSCSGRSDEEANILPLPGNEPYSLAIEPEAHCYTVSANTETGLKKKKKKKDTYFFI
jgi:hypothetical protein